MAQHRSSQGSTYAFVRDEVVTGKAPPTDDKLHRGLESTDCEATAVTKLGSSPCSALRLHAASFRYLDCLEDTSTANGVATLLSMELRFAYAEQDADKERSISLSLSLYL